MRGTLVAMILIAAYMAVLFTITANEIAEKEQARAVCNLAPYQGRYLTCTSE